MTKSATKATVSEFKPWMDRCLGEWKSLRRYLFGPKRTAGEYTTEFTIESPEDCDYRISWSGKTEGVMDLELTGNKLNRSRSYFGPDDGNTYQELYWVDPDTVVFYTAYDGTQYREEIRFLDDNTRLRQTVGRDQESREITLIGQYFEERVS